jgi:long-subunit acyl-CoA synthetase (AMP-forming)
MVLKCVLLPHGQRTQPEESGDLEGRGQVVFKGYYRDVIATSQAFTAGGWFRTGDRGLIDSNGYLRLVGRSK